MVLQQYRSTLLAHARGRMRAGDDMLMLSVVRVKLREAGLDHQGGMLQRSIRMQAAGTGSKRTCGSFWRLWLCSGGLHGLLVGAVKPGAQG